jgi:hypothetical protein
MSIAKTRDKLALNQARNTAWLHSVRRAFAMQLGGDPQMPFTTLEKRLGRELDGAFPNLDDGSRFLGRYARGGRTPSREILDRFDHQFPGTREVFEFGPYGSHLWDAVACKDPELAQDLRDRIQRDIRTGVRIECPVTVTGAPGVQDALMPASMARQLNIDGADVKAASAEIAWRIAQDPDLRHRFAPDVGAFAAHASGALISIEPGVTYSPDERARRLPVTAPVLTSLSLELLEARIRGPSGQTLLLTRQREFEMHLTRFGLSLDRVTSLAGFSFHRFLIVYRLVTAENVVT